MKTENWKMETKLQFLGVTSSHPLPRDGEELWRVGTSQRQQEWSR